MISAPLKKIVVINGNSKNDLDMNNYSKIF